MRRWISLFAFVGALLVAASPALAHPLGNFTTNLHLGIEIDDTRLDLRLIVDMAEIPTFREPLDGDGNGSIDEVELDVYAASMCREHSDDLDVTARGGFVSLTSVTSTASLQPGQNDLDTLRLECMYTAALPAGTTSIQVDNGVYGDRSGWSEIVVVGGTAAGLGDRSPSELLTNYPSSSPLDQREATISIGRATSAQVQVTDASDRSATGGPITETIASMLERAGSTGGLVAILAALALGATHALAPGHGKTLMAAYLVGRNGTPRQAAGLGLAVAVSHTLGVGALGMVTALASSQFQPETVYPWLTTGSALIVTGLGASMLIRAVRRAPHTHDHDHDHDDDHHHGHHGHDHHDHQPPADLGWRSLAMLGLAGGLVPSASAVVLLLGAAAIGRIWFGVGLVFAFGVGMSLALVAAGLIALRASQFGLSRLSGRWRPSPRLVPTLAGVAVTLVGAVLLWDSTQSFL